MDLERKELTLAVLVLAPGLILRLFLAPYTTGSDIPQFAGFADTFLRHGLSFYNYSDGSHYREEGWPYPWPYPYGPLFIVILGLLRLAAPGKVTASFQGGVYIVKAPMDWIVANKLLYIAFDTIVGVELYLLGRRLGWGRSKSLVLSILYYYNPMTIYISSIYGMFDQIPLALLLAGVLALMRGRRWWASLLWGLGVAVKPSIVIPLIPLYIHLWFKKGSREALESAAVTLAVPLILFAPFALASPSGVGVYIHGVKEISEPNYASPPVYSFNGLSSIAFYAWIHEGVNTSSLLRAWPLLFTPLYLVGLYHAARHHTPLPAMALAQAAYTASYWRVNHQYLVVTIGLLIASLPLYETIAEKALALLVTIVAGLWPLLYPISFWARVHIISPNPLVAGFLRKTSLNIVDDLIYVYYSIALTLAQILLVIVAAACLEEKARGTRP